MSKTTTTDAGIVAPSDEYSISGHWAIELRRVRALNIER
ncbi:MAG: hypothetical protein ACI8W7_004619 [Gammaproteobacteria bacterium]|jgi:hypothetical protein